MDRIEHQWDGFDRDVGRKQAAMSLDLVYFVGLDYRFGGRSLVDVLTMYPSRFVSMSIIRWGKMRDPRDWR